MGVGEDLDDYHYIRGSTVIGLHLWCVNNRVRPERNGGGEVDSVQLSYYPWFHRERNYLQLVECAIRCVVTDGEGKTPPIRLTDRNREYGDEILGA